MRLSVTVFELNRAIYFFLWATFYGNLLTEQYTNKMSSAIKMAKHISTKFFNSRAASLDNAVIERKNKQLNQTTRQLEEKVKSLQERSKTRSLPRVSKVKSSSLFLFFWTLPIRTKSMHSDVFSTINVWFRFDQLFFIIQTTITKQCNRCKIPLDAAFLEIVFVLWSPLISVNC